MKVRCNGEKPCSKCSLQGKPCRYKALRRGGRPRNSDYFANSHPGVAAGDSKPLRRLASAPTRYRAAGNSLPSGKPSKLSSRRDHTENSDEIIKNTTNNPPDIKETDDPLHFSRASLDPVSGSDSAVPELQGRDLSGIGSNETANCSEVYDLAQDSQHYFTDMEETPNMSDSTPSSNSLSGHADDLPYLLDLCPCQTALMVLLKCRIKLGGLVSNESSAFSLLIETMAKLILSSHERCISCGTDILVRCVIENIIQDPLDDSVGDMAGFTTRGSKQIHEPGRGISATEPEAEAMQHLHSEAGEMSCTSPPVWKIPGDWTSEHLPYTDGASRQLAEASDSCLDSFWRQDIGFICCLGVGHCYEMTVALEEMAPDL